MDGNLPSHRVGLSVARARIAIDLIDSVFGKLQIPLLDRLSRHDHAISYTEWVLDICKWLRGNAMEESRWLVVMLANFSGAAILWMNPVEVQVY